jgi:hypothetical protein
MNHLAPFFDNFTFSKKIIPNEKYPVWIHWSNNPYLTNKVKEGVKSGLMKTQFDQLTKQLNNLKDVPLWLKLEDSILKLSAFDLYHTLCMHFRNGQFEDQLFNCQEISFVSPTGPFKEITIVDCIHEKTIESFVYKNIIQNNLAQRSFRVFTKGSAKLSFGEFREHDLDISVEQLTDHGVLFSSDNFKLLEVIDDEQFFNIQMTLKNIKSYFDDSSQFDEAQSDLFYSNNLTEGFRVNSSHLIKSLKYDSSETGKFFLFCRYKDMQGSEHGHTLGKFVESMKQKLQAA